MDLVSLLPLTIGAAVMPLWIIVSLLLVRSKNGVAKAGAFIAGAMIVRVMQGILLGDVRCSASERSGGRGDHVIASTLFVVLGFIMLIKAVRTWFKQDDPDSPPRKWMAIFSRVSVLQAFGMGALMMAVAVKQWV